jgi:flavin-binding protein dodecin
MGSHTVAKVIEIVGSSKEGWAEAADAAVRTASKTIKNITGVHVEAMTAQVKGGRIETYKTTVKVAFGVDD